MKASLSLKRIGIWTGAFEPQPARKVQETVAELEELGYGAVWFSEAFGRETFTHQPARPSLEVEVARCPARVEYIFHQRSGVDTIILPKMALGKP